MSGNPRKAVTPSYDETSRLKELKVDNQIQMSDIVYNPLSQVTQLKTGAATGNADVEQYSYDGQTGLLTNQKVIKQNTSTTILDLSYNYNRGNSNGSINGKTGQLTNIVDNLNRNRDRVYDFDSLGRLTTAKGGIAAGGSGTANWTQQYSYDRYGNRTNVAKTGVTQDSQSVPLDGNGAMSYDNNSNRITTAGYEYDLAGNLKRGQKPDGSWQKYTYDAAGRLTQVLNDSDNWVQQINEYGTSRQRTRSWSYASADITYYVWGGSAVIAEYTAPSSNLNNVSWQKSYIYAGSRLLSTFTKNGSSQTLEFHHPDRLGTKLVTNNTANTSYQQSTLPFGTALNAESTGYSNQVFTSYDRSNVAQLDYAVNRSYSSGQGRFTTVDPIGMGAASIGNPQSLNMFAYVQNNPIDFVDPSGLKLAFYDVRRGLSCVLMGDGKFHCTEYIDRYWYDDGTDGGGVGNDPIPQSEVDKVVDRATKGECGIYVKRFLDELKKLGVKLYKNGDITEIANRQIDRAISDKTVNGEDLSPGSGRADMVNTLFSQNRSIRIGRYKAGTEATMNNIYFTTTLLHETLHHASKNGVVTDEFVSKVVEMNF